MKKLVIITDASRQLGMGHLMRQLALAKYAQSQTWSVTFISHSDVVIRRCKEEGFDCFTADDWDAIVPKVLNAQPDAVIIDIHQKEFNRFRSLGDESFKLLLMVSEVGADFTPFGDHLIRNGSDMQEWDLTQNTADTVLHSGRAWMIFRDEFQKVADIKKQPDRLIIAHGGTDPFNLTEYSLQALEHCQHKWTVDVFVTSQFQDLIEIEKLAESSKHQVNVLLDSKEVAAVMQRASAAIINGGNVRYEVCLTQTPFAAVSFQPTQYICTEQVTDLGIGFNCGLYTEIEPPELALKVDTILTDVDLRNEMMHAMQTLFDFNGPSRILKLCNDK